MSEVNIVSYGKAGSLAMKTFVESTAAVRPHGLGDQINEWLKANSDVEIVDLRYALAAAATGNQTNETHAVLVVYRPARPRGKAGIVPMRRR
jgi:hypothetical protein